MNKKFTMEINMGDTSKIDSLNDAPSDPSPSGKSNSDSVLTPEKASEEDQTTEIKQSQKDGSDTTNELAKNADVIQNSNSQRFQKYIPAPDIIEKDWKQWRIRRKVNNAINVLDFTAITFGISPKNVGQLTTKTKPTKETYKKRLILIRELIASHSDLSIIGGAASYEKTQAQNLVNFSKVMAFVLEENWPIPKELFDLNAEFSTNDVTTLTTTTLSEPERTPAPTPVPVMEAADRSKKSAASKAASVKFKNLELTLGALLLTIQKMANDGGKIPSYLIYGKKINASTLADDVTETIQEYWSNKSDKPGHDVDTVRKSFSAAIKKLPQNLQDTFIDLEDNENQESK